MEWGEMGQMLWRSKGFILQCWDIIDLYFKYMLFSDIYIKQYTIYMWNHCHKQNNEHIHHSPKLPHASFLSRLLLWSPVSK